MTRNENILIRSATHSDERELAVLAVLDGGHAVPTGEVTVAEVDGRLRAAVGSNGSAISDPFWPSAELVSMLRVHNEIERAGRTSRFLSRRPALRVAAGI